MLIGSFLTARWWAVVAAAGVILAALYLLWAYQRVFHGEPDEAEQVASAELQLRRRAAARCRSSPLIVFIGVYPKPMLDRIEPSVTALLEHVEDRTRLRRAEPVGRSDAAKPRRPRSAADARCRHARTARRSTGSRSARCSSCSAGRWCSWSSRALTPPWPKRLYACVHRRRRPRRRSSVASPVAPHRRRRPDARSSAAPSPSTVRRSG